MSKTQYGTVSVTIGDEDYELKPTLKAALAIERHFGGLRNALTGLGSLSIDAAAAVITVGAGLERKSEQVKQLPEAIFAAGVSDVAGQCVPYITALLNPGDKKEDEGDAGNA